MKTAEHIYPSMISEYTHTESFALKMKAWSFLRCHRGLGMSADKAEAIFGITLEVASLYEEEWATKHGYVLA